MKKRIGALLLAVLLLAALAGCNVLNPGFADYDVSGYIKSLLDSSYLGDHTEYIEFTKVSQAEAQENNQFTVENGAINFCNAFGIFPNDDQMAEIEAFVRDAYKLAQYTVKPREEHGSGYYVEVEIQPLTVFKDLTRQYENALAGSKDGSLLAKYSASSLENGASSAPEGGDAAEDAQNDVDVLNENDLFVTEVIRLSREALQSGTPSYAAPVIVTLEIRRSDSGDLSLDSSKIAEIDETVILFETA